MCCGKNKAMWAERKKNKGFTLIELLVVIAIIALLLSIIMPALGKAKMFAKEIVCKSNLHQYQIATEIYTNENDDRLPPPPASLYSKQKFLDEDQRYCRWHNPKYNLQSEGRDSDGTPYAGPYWPYLTATKANICPVFATLAPKFGPNHMEGNNNRSASACIGGLFEPQFSYSMNRIFLTSGGVSARKSAVSSPSQTFLWAEENMWTLKGTIDNPSMRLSNFVLNDNSLLVSDQGTDCFASYHKVSKAQLSLQQSDRLYNGGVANLLMCDGSLAWASPEDTLRYKGDVQ